MELEKYNKAVKLKREMEYLESDKIFLELALKSNDEILIKNPKLGKCLLYPELSEQILKMLLKQNEILLKKLKQEFELL